MERTVQTVVTVIANQGEEITPPKFVGGFAFPGPATEGKVAIAYVSPPGYPSNDPDNPIQGEGFPAPTMSAVAYGPFTNDASIFGDFAASVIYDPQGQAIDLTDDLLDPNGFEIVSQPPASAGVISVNRASWTLTPGSAIGDLAPGAEMTVSFSARAKNKVGNYSAPKTYSFNVKGAAAARVQLNHTTITIKRALEAGFMLVINGAMLASAAHGQAFFNSVQADGGDVRVSTGLTADTRLPVAVLSLDKANKECAIVTRLPAAMNVGDTIHLWWGNAGTPLTQPAAGAGFGAQAVFADELKAVGDYFAGTDLKGGALAVNGAPIAVAGPGGLPAIAFGANEGGTTGDKVTVTGRNLTNVHTRRFWFLQPSYENDANKHIISPVIYEGEGWVSRQASPGRISFKYRFTDGSAGWKFEPVPTSGVWHRYAIRADLSNPANLPQFFVDKLAQNVVVETARAGNYDPATGPFEVANAINNNNGRMSLLLERAGALSDAWLDAEYDNIADPLTVGEANAADLLDDPGFDNLVSYGAVSAPIEATISALPIYQSLQMEGSPMMNWRMTTEMMVTHNSVGSGDWNNPATWDAGTVPGAGSVVWVKEGHKVTINAPGIGSVGNYVARILVDGILTAADGATIKCYVDTMIGSNRAVFLVGSEAAPFSGDFEWNFPTGAIDVVADPMLIGRGIMWMGHFYVYGATKTPVALTPPGGVAQAASVIPLATVPADWRVGDRVVIQATRYPSNIYTQTSPSTDPGNQTEYATITAIDANGITIDAPLAYDHTVDGASANPGSEAPPDMAVRIGNLTRNVRFQSPEAAAPYERGHIMMMMTDKVAVHYVGFYSLGRTDKRRPAWDPSDLQDPITYDTNLKARYAFHLHGCGIHRGPIVARGLAFYDMVGHAFVNHASHEDIADIISAKSHGAHYMAEAGDEKGLVQNWVALDHTNDFNSTTQKTGPEYARHDWGQSTFFHMQSREVVLRNIFCAGGTFADGIVWQTRGAKRHKSFSGDWHETVASIPREIARYWYWNASAPPTTFDNYSYRREIIIHPIDLDGLTVVACRRGAAVIKEGNKQEHNFPTRLRNIIVYECPQGLHTEYTAHYWFDSPWLRCTTSANVTPQPGKIAVGFGNEAMAQYVIDPYIEGFHAGVHHSGINTFVQLRDLSMWEIMVIRPKFIANTVNIQNPADASMTIEVKGQADLSAATPALTLNEVNYVEATQELYITGVRTDEVAVNSIYPPAREEDVNHGRTAVFGALREYGYWQEEVTGRFFTEMHEWSFSRLTGVPFNTIVRVYLPLEPVSATGSNLADNPAHVFNGVKA